VGFLKTRSGIILVGTTHGLYRFNTAQNDFTLIDQIPPGDFVYSMLEDHNGKIWVGTVRDGIYCYDIKSNTSRKLADTYKVKDALKVSIINGIFEDSDNNLWFATDGLGLWKYDTDKQSFKYYDSNNGLPSNYIFKMLEDDDKNLWITTTGGWFL
jgi:ligand-binding sensor domain-containing protein